MVFSSLTFLLFFLPVCLLVYYLVPQRYRHARNFTLLLFSLIFYAWGEPIYIVLMIFSSLVDYTHGRLIDHFRSKRFLPRLFLISSVIINIGLLGVFKYAGFVALTINDWTGLNMNAWNLALPIGISFYTFQTMSYTIDVYRGRTPVQKNLLTFTTYVSLFPQLIAGPIVRYRTVADQLEGRQESVMQFYGGMQRLIIGLGKKVLLANTIGQLWQSVQDLPLAQMSVLTAWIGIIAFAFQIYFDFSGYSDMAIGLGRLFGFEFEENFNQPYLADSISDFWRRWHISLGSWFRDYLYFPLGGSRGSSLLTWRNLLIVWFLTGLWHGASWNFVIWGLYFGLWIGLEKAGLSRLLQKLWRPLRHVYTLLIVLVGWVLFAFDNLAIGWQFLRLMAGMSGHALADRQALYWLSSYALIFILLVAICARLPQRLLAFMRNRTRFTRFEAAARPAWLVLVLLLSTGWLVEMTFNPFLYFRF
ncbi:MAG: MBOAT family O-acyltransferase [Bacillota bacterium]|nr:MBOAT family O-acyltransferase [Bacillota bacterium]